ncbi:MAG: hypothetical protein U0324_02530 [Polyangiales bacterium]
MSDDEAPPPLDDELADLLAAERRRPDVADPAVDDRVLARVRARVAAPPPAAPRGWKREVAAAVVGALLGAGAHAALRPPPARVVVERVVERRVEVPVVRYVTAPPDASAPDAPPADVAAPTRPRPDPRPQSADDDDSALVERARVALLRARPADALAATDEHARRFPRGQFAEEREALAVQALAALGRPAEARRRAAAFHRRFPASPLGASVDAAAR